MFGGKWLRQIDRYGAWLMLLISILFFISGYGMSKHIMDPALAHYIHVQLLPVPFIVLFMIHVLKAVYSQFKRWNIFKNELTLNIYVYLLTLTITGLLLWLHFQ
jgi:hypothetical protein